MLKSYLKIYQNTRKCQEQILTVLSMSSTDKWHVYDSVLPACKLERTKSETHRIERNNCMMRYWFGRFKRKSIIVSKSKEMMDLAIALLPVFVLTVMCLIS